LILAIGSVAALTSCGGNANESTNNNTEENKTTVTRPSENTENIVDDIESDIKDSIMDPEKATHGTEEKDEPNSVEPAPKHRPMVPYGK